MIFKKAFCTNTRLMGTMMLAIEWSKLGCGVISHIFMLDSEGLGISDLFILEDMNEHKVRNFYIQKSGCLGGSNITLNEFEAVSLVNHFYEKNIINEKKVPDTFSDILIELYREKEYLYKEKNFLAKENDNLYKSKKEKYVLSVLFGKLCKNIDTENEFINYMVMRFIARDREALMYYSNSEDVSNHHITKINGTLLFNEIEKKSEDRFICNCVFEDIDGYYEAKIVVNIEKSIYKNNNDEHIDYKDINKDDISQIDYYEMEDKHKVKFRLRSILVIDTNPIYDFEVFDIISKQEVVDIYLILTSKYELENKVMSIFPSIQKLEYENGILYTQYYFDNSHVDNEIYVINNDIMFLIYIDKSKFYFATYDYESRNFIKNIIKSDFINDLKLENIFEFEQNALFDFIESGNDDFNDFLDI